ncbi:MAG: integrase core domain-containing protein, partial [Mariprofundaceae bacterium]|nr:integrase core domain-containing protein [Mariprofundaceae bacterium]
EAACRVAGVSKPAYYRWRDRLKRSGPKGLEPRSRRPGRVRRRQWDLSVVLAVKRLRLRYGWGKEKLTVLLRDEGIEVPESTVGRILSHLLRRGEVPPSPVLRLRGKSGKRPASRRPRAARMPRGFRAKLPGDLVQVDTVTVHPFPGLTVKQFTAVEVVSRWKVQCICSRATSHCARKALEEILAGMPFPVRHIQVDGGSEFKGEFEEACREKGLPLFELPPRSPRLNGHVERANGTDRHEFCGFCEVGPAIAEVRKAAKKWQHIYNHIRPHKSLNLIPPASYLASLNRKRAA